jgi:hypothetical protein
MNATTKLIRILSFTAAFRQAHVQYQEKGEATPELLVNKQTANLDELGSAITEFIQYAALAPFAMADDAAELVLIVSTNV